uniref:C-type lectin domain-containing protein n=1 Tax=Acrobeloides nanus TaxID=290746 RepID=A0A914DWC2_9BILA
MTSSLVSITSLYVQKWMLDTLTRWQKCSILYPNYCINNVCSLPNGFCEPDGKCVMKLNTLNRIWLNAETVFNNFTEWHDGSKIGYTDWATGEPNYARFNASKAMDDKKLRQKSFNAQLLRKEHTNSNKLSWNSSTNEKTKDPNPKIKSSDYIELCVQMELSTGKWYAADCNDLLYATFCIYKSV